MPLEGQVINGLSVLDRTRLINKFSKIIAGKGYNPNIISRTVQSENGGVITNDEDVFNYSTLSTFLPAVTINVDENIGDLPFIYNQVVQQVFGLLPQKPILFEEFIDFISKKPIVLALKIRDSLPVNSDNRNVIDFSNIVRSLTSHNNCKAVVLSSKLDNIPTEIGRNLLNIPIPQKI